LGLQQNLHEPYLPCHTDAVQPQDVPQDVAPQELCVAYLAVDAPQTKNALTSQQHRMTLQHLTVHANSLPKTTAQQILWVMGVVAVVGAQRLVFPLQSTC
jgi:hypothetical protein